MVSVRDEAEREKGARLRNHSANSRRETCQNATGFHWCSTVHQFHPCCKGTVLPSRRFDWFAKHRTCAGMCVHVCECRCMCLCKERHLQVVTHATVRQSSYLVAARSQKSSTECVSALVARLHSTPRYHPFQPPP